MQNISNCSARKSDYRLLGACVCAHLKFEVRQHTYTVISQAVCKGPTIQTSNTTSSCSSNSISMRVSRPPVTIETTSCGVEKIHDRYSMIKTRKKNLVTLFDRIKSHLIDDFHASMLITHKIKKLIIEVRHTFKYTPLPYVYTHVSLI